MIHQDLTTWFDSPAHVDETYIEVRPLLDDLSRFRRASPKDPCLRVSRRYNCHGISHTMNHYSRTSSHFVDDYSRTSYTSSFPLIIMRDTS